MFQGPLKLKSADDIKRIGDSGAIIRELFKELRLMNLDGLSTWEVDSFIDDFILKKHARPAFKTLPDYTFASCISVNEEIVHGLPSKKRKLKSSDIVSIDCGAALHGYFSDACITLGVGIDVKDEHNNLIVFAQRALKICIDELYPGNTTGCIGAALGKYLDGTSYRVMHQFTGHGVGFALHEAPIVPHHGGKQTGIKLQEGMVLAIEPVIKEGNAVVYLKEDGWTAAAEDNMYSAQFEHTVAVTKHGPLILT